MTGPGDRPLTPGEALAKLFLDNADRGANAENDDLVVALRERARAIQALADAPHGTLRGYSLGCRCPFCTSVKAAAVPIGDIGTAGERVSPTQGSTVGRGARRE